MIEWYNDLYWTVSGRCVMTVIFILFVMGVWVTIYTFVGMLARYIGLIDDEEP